MTPLYAQNKAGDGTNQWILTTISNTNERAVVNQTLIVVDLVLHSITFVMAIFLAFWLKKKFRESAEHYQAIKLAYLAAQVEKDMTKADNSRAVQRVIERAEEMKAHSDQTLTQIKETVSSAIQPTVVAVDPAPARRPGDPDRRDPNRPDPALAPPKPEAAR